MGNEINSGIFGIFIYLLSQFFFIFKKLLKMFLFLILAVSVYHTVALVNCVKMVKYKTE